MKSWTIIASQAMRFARPTRPLYIVDVIRALHLRYAFVRVPLTAEEIRPPNEGDAIMFSHGRMEHEGRTIVIDSLQIFREALSVTVEGGSTDDAELVLADLLKEGADVIALTPNHPRLYVSQLEFASDVTFDDVAPPTARLSLQLSEMVGRYVSDVIAPQPINPPAFRINTVALKIDPMQYTLPCDFRVERRLNRGFHENVFFAQAPLRTSDHVVALEAFENALASRR